MEILKTLNNLIWMSYNNRSGLVYFYYYEIHMKRGDFIHGYRYGILDKSI